VKPKVLIVGTDTAGAPEWLDEFKAALDADFIDNKPNATHIIYIFTPENFGIESAVNVVDDSKDRAKKMVVCIHDPEMSFSEEDTDLLFHVCQKVHNNGAIWMPSLEEVAMYVNLKMDPQKKIKLKKISEAKRKEEELQLANAHLTEIDRLTDLHGEALLMLDERDVELKKLKAEIVTLKPETPVEEQP